MIHGRYRLVRTIAGILALCLAWMCLSSCAKKTDEPPEAVMDFLEQYMEAYSIDTEESVKYVYFREGDEALRDAYIATHNHLLDYRILSYEKLSDNLHRFDLDLKTPRTLNQTNSEYEKVTHYVGILDGTYYYILNARDIPAQLSEGLDVGPVNTAILVIPDSLDLD